MGASHPETLILLSAIPLALQQGAPHCRARASSIGGPWELVLNTVSHPGPYPESEPGGQAALCLTSPPLELENQEQCGVRDAAPAGAGAVTPCELELPGQDCLRVGSQ